MMSATSSGPASRIACSISSSSAWVKATGSSPLGWRYALVSLTWVTSIGIGRKGSRQKSMPVNERAPRLVPWYAVLRAIALVRCG